MLKHEPNLQFRSPPYLMRGLEAIAELDGSRLPGELQYAPGRDRGERLIEYSKADPVPFKTDRRFAGRHYWLYRSKVYSTVEDDLQPDEVKALVEEKENKKRVRIARAKAVAAMAKDLDRVGERQAIPQRVKVAVWQRDKGQCVNCGSTSQLQFDHDIPRSMGGADTVQNLRILCAPCNQAKGASL